jgi:hypothetical protein
MKTSGVTRLVVLFFLSGVPAVAGAATSSPDAEHGLINHPTPATLRFIS